MPWWGSGVPAIEPTSFTSGGTTVEPVKAGAAAMSGMLAALSADQKKAAEIVGGVPERGSVARAGRPGGWSGDGRSAGAVPRQGEHTMRMDRWAAVAVVTMAAMVAMVFVLVAYSHQAGAGASDRNAQALRQGTVGSVPDGNQASVHREAPAPTTPTPVRIPQQTRVQAPPAPRVPVVRRPAPTRTYQAPPAPVTAPPVLRPAPRAVPAGFRQVLVDGFGTLVPARWTESRHGDTHRFDSEQQASLAIAAGPASQQPGDVLRQFARQLRKAHDDVRSTGVTAAARCGQGGRLLCRTLGYSYVAGGIRYMGTVAALADRAESELTVATVRFTDTQAHFDGGTGVFDRALGWAYLA